MKILLTGANGFLGHYLSKQLINKGYDLIATGRGEADSAELASSQYVQMDFTDPFVVHKVFEKFRPEIVIHAGAMTNVDACEQDKDDAFATNVEGTIHLLLNAEANRSQFIFLSTDFVFSGEKGNYDESDKPDPVNFYGITKADAE